MQDIEIVRKELTKIMSETSLKECNIENISIVDRCIVLLDILEAGDNIENEIENRKEILLMQVKILKLEQRIEELEKITTKQG